MFTAIRDIINTRKKTGALLTLGFGIIIISFIAVSFTSYKYMNSVSDKLSEVITEYSLRAKHGHAMRNAARERSLLLFEMTQTEDEFERDDHFMELRRQGELFLKSRESIIQSGLSKEELKVITEQRDYSLVAGPLQYQVIELLDNQDISAAHILLLNEAIPAQNKVLDSLEKFIELQQQNNHQALDQTSEELDINTRKVLTLTTSGVVVSIIIALFVMFSIRMTMAAQQRAEHELIVVNHDLEKRVELRTTELKNVNQTLKQLSQYDLITGLPNRMLFNEVAERMLSRAKRFNTHIAIMFLDLDGFKKINDTYGHEVGDNLLKQVGQRINEATRTEDLLARIGGDEFALVLGDISYPEHIDIIAKKIIKCNEKTYLIKNNECLLGVSIGVSSFPQDANNVSDLLRYADKAMYRIKKNGKNNYCFHHIEDNND